MTAIMPIKLEIYLPHPLSNGQTSTQQSDKALKQKYLLSQPSKEIQLQHTATTTAAASNVTRVYGLVGRWRV